MRIVIDLQGAQTESRFRVIGRYSLSLSLAIARNRGDHEVIIALNGMFPETIESIREAFRDLLPQESIRVWFAKGPVRESVSGNETLRSVAELIRGSFFASLYPDVVLLTSLFEGFADDAVTSFYNFTPPFRTAVVLYDLIPFTEPDKYLAPNKLYRDHYTKKIEFLKKMDGYLAISAHSAQEGIKYLNLNEKSVVNISTACDELFKKIQHDKFEDLSRLNIAKPFVLYTGGADDRKNIVGLIKAFASLPIQLKNQYQLVIAGKIPDSNLEHLHFCAKKSGLGSTEYLFIGYVTNEELITLYNRCSLFIMPSYKEGFGLPALEAINCGAPVIGSNCSSIPEVIGYKEALFDPYDINDISKKIEKALTDDNFRSDLVSHESKQISKFSWDKSAKRAIEFFEKNIKKNNLISVKNQNILEKELISKISEINGIEKLSDRDLTEIAKAIALNFSHSFQQRIFVDVSELSQRDAKSGIQRVTRSILHELINLSPENFNVIPVYSTTDENGYRYAKKFINRFVGKIQQGEDDHIEFQAGDIFLGLDLQHYVVDAQYRYLQFLNMAGVKIYFVVYDLLPLQLPEFFQDGTKNLHYRWLKTISQFDGAVCISKSVADELQEWVGSNVPERTDKFEIKWFHLGADIDNSIPTLGIPEDADHILSQLTSNKSFLMVGTIEPRKRQNLVLEAFEYLWNEDLSVNLVIVGKKGWLTEDLCDRIRKHREYGKRLFWLEGISDEYLEKVYTASTCLIAASEGEGFGLPLIEAAQKKIPIIARDIPVFREVAGKHAFYFSVTTGDELAGSIKEWITLYNDGRHPKSDDMPWLTWKESTKQLLKAIGIESEGSGSDDE
jgi:glycosyltransferase involved in cell wall biosynthesis